MPENNNLTQGSRIQEHLAGFASKGVPLDVAQQSLRSAGWTTEEINEALKTQPYPIPSENRLNTVAAALPVYGQIHEAESNSIVRFILPVSLFVLCAVGIFIYVSKPAAEIPMNAGTISIENCFKEGGVISGGLNDKVCQIGSVKLSITTK